MAGKGDNIFSIPTIPLFSNLYHTAKSNKKTTTATKPGAVTSSKAVYVRKAMHIYPKSEGASQVLQFEQISADQQLRERNSAYKFFSIH